MVFPDHLNQSFFDPKKNEFSDGLYGNEAKELNWRPRASEASLKLHNLLHFLVSESLWGFFFFLIFQYNDKLFTL